jgi:ribosome-associated protein
LLGRPTSASSRTTTTAKPDEERTLSADTTESRTLALRTARAASDKKAEDIRILELGPLIGITDYFVLCSARSDRQLRTVVEEIQFQVKRDEGRAPLRREGSPEAGWMVLDYGLIVVHAFTEEQRRFYDLERLWSDAPTVPFDAGVGAGTGSASGSNVS